MFHVFLITVPYLFFLSLLFVLLVCLPHMCFFLPYLYSLLVFRFRAPHWCFLFVFLIRDSFLLPICAAYNYFLLVLPVCVPYLFPICVLYLCPLICSPYFCSLLVFLTNISYLCSLIFYLIVFLIGVSYANSFVCVPNLCSFMFLPFQVTVRNAVNVVTGDVRVNGEVVPVSDKTSHVEVLPNFCDPTIGRVIKFKALTKGFS